MVLHTYKLTSAFFIDIGEEKTLNKQKTQNLNSRSSLSIPTLKSESQLSFYEKYNLVSTKIITGN
jgi:hypothetical protein